MHILMPQFFFFVVVFSFFFFFFFLCTVGAVGARVVDGVVGPFVVAAVAVAAFSDLGLSVHTCIQLPTT